MMHIALGVVLGLFIWHFVLPVALVLLAHMSRVAVITSLAVFGVLSILFTLAGRL
jgi:hypothetical protein